MRTNEAREMLDLFERLGITDEMSPDFRGHVERSETLREAALAPQETHDNIKHQASIALGRGEIDIDGAVDQIMQAATKSEAGKVAHEALDMASRHAAGLALKALNARGEDLITDVLGPRSQAVVDSSVKRAQQIPAGVADADDALAAGKAVGQAWLECTNLWREWLDLREAVRLLEYHGVVSRPPNGYSRSLLGDDEALRTETSAMPPQLRIPLWAANNLEPRIRTAQEIRTWYREQERQAMADLVPSKA